MTCSCALPLRRWLSDASSGTYSGTYSDATYEGLDSLRSTCRGHLIYSIYRFISRTSEPLLLSPAPQDKTVFDSGINQHDMQASRSWHNHLMTYMKSLGFEQCLADACVMSLIESGTVSIVTVVRVDDIFAVGSKSRCDQFCEDLNRLVSIINLCVLRWYAGCRFVRDWDAGTLTISQLAFAENTAAKFGVCSGRRTPIPTGLKLEKFDPSEPDSDRPFRELVGYLMWLANQTQPTSRTQ